MTNTATQNLLGKTSLIIALKMMTVDRKLILYQIYE
jgi:hypothetical protein